MIAFAIVINKPTDALCETSRTHACQATWSAPNGAAQLAAPAAGCPAQQLTPFLIRLALSCLVDADHSDTARNYCDPVALPGPALAPGER